MDNINSYIHKELLKIPFDLFNIISKFIQLNQESNVAFVGGYVRDLLITKIHKKTLFKPLDIDIVIEGSSIDLAKFIKKNILNVDLCLIKEFEIYNTVELNINDFKIDIATARKEIYKSPGINPLVKNTTIKEDLKRRDFSVNAIAFDVSKKEIYDFYQGIVHIKKKELHLLHEKSIQDDPSRLLRCAKYASRLNFKISRESLKQSQNIVKSWPWVNKKDNNEFIFPAGISIRLRMELSEIYNNDNLSKIISTLDEWGLISILNNNIKINNRFLRGLKWIKKLDGKYILYLLKDSANVDLSCQRFFINTKERKILGDYLKTKKFLEAEKEKYLNFCPSNWTEFIETNNLDTEAVKLLICDGGLFWRQFFKWLYIYRFIKSKKNGETLIKEGWRSGKDLGLEIKRLRYIEIDKTKRISPLL